MIPVYISVGISAAIWLYVIYRNDRFEPEPVGWILLVGIAGGVMSAIPASVLNTAAAVASGVTSGVLSGSERAPASGLFLFSLFVGFNEEAMKAAVAVFILKRLREFNEPVDGLIYSMTLALGFAAFENIEYTVGGGLGVLIVRSFTSVPLHIGLASIWGTGIARAKFYRGERYLKTVTPYVVTAALLHTLYNYVQFINAGNPAVLLFAMVFAIAVIFYASRKLRFYLRESPFRKAGFCPACGTENGFWARYCKSCGSYIASDYCDLCPSCGSRCRAGSGFCRHCGEPLSGSRPLP